MASGEAHTIAESIALERRWLESMRELASHLVDSTHNNVHELKKRVQAILGDPSASGMTLHLMSFGFRNGLPPEADYVFDVRFLPNPHFVPELRDRNGTDKDVMDFVLADPNAERMLKRLTDLFSEILPLAQDEGKANMTIAIGCTGGQHRSVAMIESLGEKIARFGVEPYTSHRDIPR